jgi:hypothetical protein
VTGATVEQVDESKAVLERLARIEALDRRGADSRELVGELRALLVEAEAWSRREGGEAGARAVDELRSALDSAQDQNVLAHVSVADNP